MKLFISEWERLWSRKVTWLMLVAMPLIVYATAHYYAGHNLKISHERPEYTVFANFPVLSLNEQLMTTFNVIVLLLAAYLITEEYRSGQLRLILLRAHSFPRVMLVKWLVLVVTMFLFLLCYFAVSYVVGFFMFERVDSLPLFYQKTWVSEWQAFLYNLQYYAVAYVTLVVLSSIMFCIAMLSQTTTAAMGIGVAYGLFSMAYPTVLQYFSAWLDHSLFMKLYFSSLPMIQWQGIVLMLAGHEEVTIWNSLMLVGYFLLSTMIAYVAFTRKDRWI